jgi:hypothetical protein
MRKVRWACVAMALAAGGAAPASAAPQDGDSGGLMTECGGIDLPDSVVDLCLERVRVREETDPTPELQSLEARLEQRAAGRTESVQAAPRASPDVEKSGGLPPDGSDSPAATAQSGQGAATTDAQEEPPPANNDDLHPPVSDDSGADGDGMTSVPPQRDIPDFGADEPPSGPNAEDEPPVADPPDNSSAAGPDDNPR